MDDQEHDRREADTSVLQQGDKTTSFPSFLLPFKIENILHSYMFDVIQNHLTPNPTEMACAIVSEKTANLQSLTV